VSQIWLIGHPVAHSLSPAMHNAAFDKLGLPHRYTVRDVTDAQLGATLDRLRRADVLGANVTIPHGEAALQGFAIEPLPGMIADLVPIAEETPLVRRAREAQHVRVMDGLLMLLHQAARSFELWTGVPAPLEVMRAALPRRV